jgi:hypothetical protein
MSNSYDFVSLPDATAALGASLPAGAAAGLPLAISAASRALRRYMARDIVLTAYDECYDGGGFNTLLLRQYPIVGPIQRLATTPTPVLTVTNTDNAANQRATAALASTGDGLSAQTVTGLTLSRSASGVTTPDASTMFATYTTTQAAVSHINAIGGGWSATATPGYGLWPTADLRAVQGAANALTPARAVFHVHAYDLTGFTVNERSGVVTLGTGQAGYADGGGYFGAFPAGTQNIRAVYTAGYATVPEDLQQACLVTVQDWLSRLNVNRQFKSENAKDYSYVNWDKAGGLPEEAIAIVKGGGWRSYRRN